MSASFSRPKPTARDMFLASLAVTPPDLISLAGSIEGVAAPCAWALKTIEDARTWGEAPDDEHLADAEAALMRAARAIEAYRGRA